VHGIGPNAQVGWIWGDVVSQRIGKAASRRTSTRRTALAGLVVLVAFAAGAGLPMPGNAAEGSPSGTIPTFTKTLAGASIAKMYSSGLEWDAAGARIVVADTGNDQVEFYNPTTGARSGEERTTPLMYQRDGDRYVVVASKAGEPDNPAWYHNLKVHPVATVEVAAGSGTESFEVRAQEAEGEERERLWAERVAIAPRFGDYQRKTSRRIPVMILERIG